MVNYIFQCFKIIALLFNSLNIIKMKKRIKPDMSIKKYIGKRIKEIRKSKHLSQEQLSEMLDISQNALSYIETGENFFSAETLENLINSLEVEPYELFNFDHLQSHDNLLGEIVKMLEENPDKVQDIYKITKALTL